MLPLLVTYSVVALPLTMAVLELFALAEQAKQDDDIPVKAWAWHIALFAATIIFAVAFILLRIMEPFL